MTAMLAEPPLNLGISGIEQIYITHCLYGEGTYKQAGFNILAASTEDALLHRFALEYPHYELPARMAAPAAVEDTPRRLALVRIPGGSSALIHSAFVPGDHRGRANNFFSHVLIGPGLRPRDALAAWASPDWAIRCDREDSNGLPQREDLPAPGPLNDEAVTAFLQKDSGAQDSNLATLIFPRRLAADVTRRRELLRLTLRGCQRVLEATATSQRSRFYIMAEPGLTALLLYAAARLFPDALVARLTFSTYEPACRNLRFYKHARVVGTYSGHQQDSFDKDFYTTLGYGLDTFNHDFSPDLVQQDTDELDEWIDLAADGDWETIGKIHALLGKRNPTVVSLQDAKKAFHLSALLTSGEAGPEDLLAARQAPWGQPILDRHQERIWPVVRDGCLSDPRLREEFADLLEQHVPELEKRTAEALRRQQADWQSHWQMLRFALKQDPVKVWEAFDRILPELPYPAELRLGLLLELQSFQPAGPPHRMCSHRLLKNCTPDDLQALATSPLDRRWFVRALCYALLEPQTTMDAVRYVHTGDDALVRVFWRQFKLIKREAQRQAILAPLFPRSEEGRRFLSRSLKLSGRLRPETLGWLLDSLGAWSKEWHPFWSSGNHLARLLKLLKGFGEEAAPIWERLCAQIDRDVLVPGDADQRVLLLELAAARDRPGGQIPARAAAFIADWNILREHFEKASAIPEPDRRKVIDACNRRGIDPVDLLAEYFQRFIVPQGLEKEVLDDFLGFFHSFCPSAEDYSTCGCRLLWWLRIVKTCPEESGRGLYQRYYLEHFVPFEFRWRLAEETCQGGKLLPSVFESLSKPTEPGPTPFAAGSAQNAPADFFPLDSTARRRRLAKKLLLSLAAHAASGIAAVLLYCLLTRWLPH